MTVWKTTKLIFKSYTKITTKKLEKTTICKTTKTFQLQKPDDWKTTKLQIYKLRNNVGKENTSIFV